MTFPVSFSITRAIYNTEGKWKRTGGYSIYLRWNKYTYQQLWCKSLSDFARIGCDRLCLSAWRCLVSLTRSQPRLLSHLNHRNTFVRTPMRVCYVFSLFRFRFNQNKDGPWHIDHSIRRKCAIFDRNRVWPCSRLDRCSSHSRSLLLDAEQSISSAYVVDTIDRTSVELHRERNARRTRKQRWRRLAIKVTYASVTQAAVAPQGLHGIPIRSIGRARREFSSSTARIGMHWSTGVET